MSHEEPTQSVHSTVDLPFLDSRVLVKVKQRETAGGIAEAPDRRPDGLPGDKARDVTNDPHRQAYDGDLTYGKEVHGNVEHTGLEPRAGAANGIKRDEVRGTPPATGDHRTVGGQMSERAVRDNAAIGAKFPGPGGPKDVAVARIHCRVWPVEAKSVINAMGGC